MDKENILNNSGINPKNCMNKSKTELKKLADSLNIPYNVKTTKEQLCSIIFGEKFECPKKGSREDVNKLQPSGNPSEDINILDILLTKIYSEFVIEQFKDLIIIRELSV